MRPFPYSAVGRDTTLFKRCTDLILSLAHVQLYCSTPLYTTVGADAARFVYGWLRDPLLWYLPYTPFGRPFIVLPPYTASKTNAACFGTMGVGFLCNTLLCYPPPLPPRLHLG